MLKATLGMMRDSRACRKSPRCFIRHGLGDIVRAHRHRRLLERAGQILRAARPPTSRSSSRRSACASRWRSSARRSSSSARCWRRASTCSRRAGSPSSRSCTARSRRCRSRSCCPSSTRALGGARPFEVFRDLDTRAHGAASIAQVHRAKLQDGTPVVLKIRRPGIRDEDRGRPAPARPLSPSLIESEMPEARRYHPVRDRDAVRALARARARLRHRGAQHRALRARTSRTIRTSSSRGLSRVDERVAARAGAHRRHSRHRSPRRSMPPASTASCSRRAAPRRSSR